MDFSTERWRRSGKNPDTGRSLDTPEMQKIEAKIIKTAPRMQIFALRALSTPICITFRSKPIDLKRKIAAKRGKFFRGKNRREAAKFFPPILKSKKITLY